jgi:DNA-directed RNA polymerase subunit L
MFRVWRSKENEKGEPYSFDFVVESIGVLDPAYIVRRACEVGEAMVSRYVNIHTAGNALPEELTIVPTTDCDMIGYDFLLKGHDHTLGNLLQTWLAENHMDVPAGSEKVHISFAGYAVPHPLRDEMVVRIGVDDGKEETARRAFAQACKGCAEMFGTLRAEWETATRGTPTARRTLRQSAAAAAAPGGGAGAGAGAGAAAGASGRPAGTAAAAASTRPKGPTTEQQAAALRAGGAAKAALQQGAASKSVLDATTAAVKALEKPATDEASVNKTQAAIERAQAVLRAAVAANPASAALKAAEQKMNEANASLGVGGLFGNE